MSLSIEDWLKIIVYLALPDKNKNKLTLMTSESKEVKSVTFSKLNFFIFVIFIQRRKKYLV
jgi:hypothetical protein